MENRIGEIQSIKGYDKNGNVVIEFEEAHLTNLSVLSEETRATGGRIGKTLSTISNKILEFEGQAKSCNFYLNPDELKTLAEDPMDDIRSVLVEKTENLKRKSDYEIFGGNGQIEIALQNIGISARDAEGAFRDLNDVLEELGGKWDDLSDIQQAGIIAPWQRKMDVIVPNDESKPIKLVFEGDVIDNDEIDKHIASFIDAIQI